jgi:hypothetical protein
MLIVMRPSCFVYIEGIRILRHSNYTDKSTNYYLTSVSETNNVVGAVNSNVIVDISIYTELDLYP